MLNNWLSEEETLTERSWLLRDDTECESGSAGRGEGAMGASFRRLEAGSMIVIHGRGKTVRDKA